MTKGAAETVAGAATKVRQAVTGEQKVEEKEGRKNQKRLVR
mgnify:CR=1 FL=1